MCTTVNFFINTTVIKTKRILITLPSRNDNTNPLISVSTICPDFCSTT